MSSRRVLIALLSCCALAACNTMYTHYGDEDPGLGEAPKFNAAVQTINPTPVYSANSAQPGSNGEVGAAAVKRYRTDKVKPTESLGTSAAGGGSGTGMSSGPQ